MMDRAPKKKYTINPKPITDAGSIDVLNPKAGDTTLASIKVDNETLTVGKDYTVSLTPSQITAGIDNSAEITFQRNYSGKVTKTFSAKYDLNDYYNVTVSRNSGAPTSYVYNGVAQSSDTDYTVNLTKKKNCLQEYLQRRRITKLN